MKYLCDICTATKIPKFIQAAKPKIKTKTDICQFVYFMLCCSVYCGTKLPAPSTEVVSKL